MQKILLPPATEEWILLDDQPTTSKSSGEERAQKFSQQLQEIIDNHSKVDGPTLLPKKSVLSLRSELGQADLDRRSMLAPFEVKNFTEKGESFAMGFNCFLLRGDIS